MIVLNPTYTLRVEVRDRSRLTDSHGTGAVGGVSGLNINPASPYRFYGSFGETTGVDDLLKLVREVLKKEGLDASVTLERFEHRA